MYSHKKYVNRIRENGLLYPCQCRPGKISQTVQESSANYVINKKVGQKPKGPKTDKIGRANTHLLLHSHFLLSSSLHHSVLLFMLGPLHHCLYVFFFLDFFIFEIIFQTSSVWMVGEWAWMETKTATPVTPDSYWGIKGICLVQLIPLTTVISAPLNRTLTLQVVSGDRGDQLCFRYPPPQCPPEPGKEPAAGNNQTQNFSES